MFSYKQHTHIRSPITLQRLQNYKLECLPPNKLFLTYVNALNALNAVNNLNAPETIIDL